jgi:ribosomal protein L37AE/L43A
MSDWETAKGMLSKVSGIDRTEIQQIAERVLANNRKLDACGCHRFVKQPKSRPLRSVYKCDRCGGTVDGAAFRWYTRGHKDALI